MKVKKEILDRCIKFDDYVNQQLKDPDAQAEWLKIAMDEYNKDGNFVQFFHSLEQVIKARGSVRQFAEQLNIDRSNLVNMLHGKTKPSMDTVMKILDGLGYSLTVNKKETA